MSATKQTRYSKQHSTSWADTTGWISGEGSSLPLVHHFTNRNKHIYMEYWPPKKEWPNNGLIGHNDFRWPMQSRATWTKEQENLPAHKRFFLLAPSEQILNRCAYASTGVCKILHCPTMNHRNSYGSQHRSMLHRGNADSPHSTGFSQESRCKQLKQYAHSLKMQQSTSARLVMNTYQQ